LTSPSSSANWLMNLSRGRPRSRSAAPWTVISFGSNEAPIKPDGQERACQLTAPAATSLRASPSHPSRHARRAASIVDTPPGHISLGAHRKARIGRYQHARCGRGYRSQPEPATVPGAPGGSECVPTHPLYNPEVARGVHGSDSCTERPVTLDRRSRHRPRMRRPRSSSAAPWRNRRLTDPACSHWPDRDLRPGGNQAETAVRVLTS
jgi:hypothetical protein